MSWLVSTPSGVFSRHLSWTEMTPGPALTSVKPLDQWYLCSPRRPLFCYWLWKQEALGATHILTAAHSLNCVDVHMCVCVCVCPGPLVYPWPPCTVITTHSCHLPLSLSLSLSRSSPAPPSPPLWLVWSQQWILMSLAMINLINNKYINLASRQGLILTSGKAQAPFNCCL